jgi:hypothetical protein
MTEVEIILDEIIRFLESRSGNIALIDHIKNDLDIHVDEELSEIKDIVTDKMYPVSLENIIMATKKRIIVAIESFKKM